jgi:hypothetical protein
MSSTAAQQAAELTKETNLLGSLSSGVANVSTKVTDVGSKAWTNINSYWSTSFGTGNDSAGGENVNASSSFSNFNVFGANRSGYDSMSGETMNSNNNNSGNSFSGYNAESSATDSYLRNSASSSSLNRKQQQQQPAKSAKDDWNWEETDDWTETAPAKSSTKASSKKPASNVTKKASDLINFDDDNWEAVDGPTSEQQTSNKSKSK